MKLLIFLLLSLCFFILISVFYLKYRKSFVIKYIYSDKVLGFYTRKRIYFKSLLFLFLSILFLLWINILFLIIADFKVESNSFIYLIILNIIFSVFLFGTGIYISVNILEEYLLRKIKITKESKVLRLGMETLHGPISHILQFQSIFYSLFLITFFEIKKNIQMHEGNTIIFALIGFIAALTCTFALIGNNTWKHQIFPSILLLSLSLISYGLLDVNFNYKFTFLFLTFIFSLNLFLIAKYIHFKVSNHTYYYDQLDLNKYKDQIELKIKEFEKH